MKDEILEEVWRNRASLLAEHGYNLDSYVAHLKKLEKASGRKLRPSPTKHKKGYWGRTSAAHRRAALTKS